MYNKPYMTQGGRSGDQKSKQIIKRAGLIIPLFLTVYGLLVLADIVPGSLLASLPALIILMVSWLIMGILQVVVSPKTQNDTFVRLIGYHLLAGGYMLLISGLYSPMAALWLVLMLASYIYTGTNGLKLNLVVLTLLLLAETLVRGATSEMFMTTDTWLLLLVVLSGLIAVAIIKYHEIDQVALVHSQRQEMIQRERTLTLVNNLADAVLSTDPNGVIQVYNAAALNLLDTNDSLNGRKIDKVVSLVDEDDNPVSLMEELKKARSVTIRDDLSLNIDEERTRLEVTLSPIRRSFSGKNRQDDGYILILRDITKSKSLEEERDEFISVVSHELRTPITIVEGTISNVQVILERGEIKPKVLSAAINSAHEQIMFLARMVNDLSTLSRAERGLSDEMEVIDVKELAYKVYNTYRPEAEAKGLLLNIDTRGKLGKVFASRLYLEELLQNLITNAIKYTHKGSITLDVRSGDNKVVFSVKDTGIGISKSDQKSIFKKFYRAEDYRTRETKGTGLGLYVSSKLARKLNTSIELSSRLNHGSTFSFNLQSLKPEAKKKPSSKAVATK